MKHNYFCRFLFITIIFLGMQTSLKGGTSITSTRTTLISNESDIRDTLTERGFVYRSEESFTTSEDSSPTTIAFDAEAFTQGREIHDNHNFSAIGKTFNIYIVTPAIAVYVTFRNFNSKPGFPCGDEFIRTSCQVNTIKTKFYQ